MRGVASWVALGLMMALFHRVSAGAALEARATLALGFLLLAAFLGGDLAQRARLPRITGFLLAGFAVGPAWLGLVRRDEVEALGFISDAAVGLIALAAGSALTIGALREHRTTLPRLVGGALAAPFLIVTLVVLSVSPWFPLTAHQRFGNALAVAVTLGALAATSSPVVAQAMTTELGARGPVARSLLAMTILKDVAVGFLFTIVLITVRTATSGGALNIRVAGGALAALTASVGVGVLLGYALGAYLRLMRRHTTLVLLAAACVATVTARVGHLAPIVVGLALGCSLEHFAPVESDRVREALHYTWFPVSLVFFALFGATLRIGALAELWPWVLLLVGLRAVALRYGLWWAGRDSRVPAALAREGWWGLLSQAGIALWVAQVARRGFPQWGVSLASLAVAMSALHEAVGPWLFRHALARAEELPRPGARASAAVGDEAVVTVRSQA